MLRSIDVCLQVSTNCTRASIEDSMMSTVLDASPVFPEETLGNNSGAGARLTILQERHVHSVQPAPVADPTKKPANAVQQVTMPSSTSSKDKLLPITNSLRIERVPCQPSISDSEALQVTAENPAASDPAATVRTSKL
ncbi:hypothetical protein VTK73DRAFT_1304 [Phialemonium thermophilum]|uniref:Uncharacterized protein n=1 Tax=Phialemonium thermophilum TaxID=223376 RepID=A0ABR3X9Z6_9PEZI